MDRYIIKVFFVSLILLVIEIPSFLQNVTITAHTVERGFLVLGPVNIGKDCVIGMMSVVMPSTSLDNGVALAPMTMVPLGATLPPNTTWAGSPARKKEGPLLPEGPMQQSGFATLSSLDEDAERFALVQGESLPAGVVALREIIYLITSLVMTCMALLPMALGVVYTWRVPLVSKLFYVLYLILKTSFIVNLMIKLTDCLYLIFFL